MVEHSGAPDGASGGSGIVINKIQIPITNMHLQLTKTKI
jgi:hypothetical protein